MGKDQRASAWRVVLVAQVAAALLNGCLQSSTYSADLAGSTIQVYPDVVLANGHDAALVTVLVKRRDGSPIAGVQVHIDVEACQVTQPTAHTDAAGKATGSVMCTVVGARTVSASIIRGGYTERLAATATINFAADASPTVVAGTSLDLQATAQDDLGLPDTTFHDTVVFTSSDPQATLPGPHTVMPADRGRITLPGALVLRTAGSQSVTLTDSNTARTVTVLSFKVIAAAATHFTVTAPTSLTAGGAAGVTVMAGR